MNDPAGHPQPNSLEVESLVRCARCGYDLKGLAVEGQCPECGGAYDPTMVLSKPPFTAFEICIMFGWPIILMVVLLFVALQSPGMFCILVALFPVVMINGAVQHSLWRKRSVPSGLSSQRGEALAVPYRRLAFSLLLTCLIGPPVVFGGCVVIVFGTLSGGH